MSGDSKTSRFKSVYPVMIYVHQNELKQIKGFAKASKKSVSALAREGIRMRIAGTEDSYTKGFEDGLNMAMDIINKNSWAQMTLPNGLSVGNILCDSIKNESRKEIIAPAEDEPDPWELARENINE